jgi:hypothetical protein
MIISTWRTAVVALLALTVSNVGFMGAAQAGIVGTAAMLKTDREVHLAAIQSQLNRADVRAAMAEQGVTPSAIDQRVANLSDGELAALSKQMREAPAGGILALIGATFVVLLILEWTGVIDIFKKTPTR